MPLKVIIQQNRQNVLLGVRSTVIGDDYYVAPASVYRYYAGIGLHRELYSYSHKKPYREGGPFSSRERKVIRYNAPDSTSWTYQFGDSNNTFQDYSYSGLSALESSEFPIGRLASGDSESDQPPLIGDLDFTIQDLSVTDGPAAWKKYSPGAPIMSLGQSLIEIRDVPKLLTAMKTRLRDYMSLFGASKDLSNKFLAHQFGYRPLVQDLRSLVKIQEKLATRIAQLQRDNGRSVRREGVIRLGHSFTEVPYSGYYSTGIGLLDPRGYPVSQSCTKGTSTYLKHKFSGRFKYYIPDFDNNHTLRMNVIRAKLLDAYPSPSLLYQVMPWSWLIDWFTNIGDIISNLSTDAADNLVAEYAYMMGTYELVKTHHLKVRFPSGYVENCYVIDSESALLRSGANPYGFGLTNADLSLKQRAILAALGLQRLL